VTKPALSEPTIPTIKNENPHAPDFLHFSHLTKSYLEGGKRRVVLQDASLAIGRGEFLAILGRSGSGKTTLLNLISGIDQADQGMICLNGTNLTALNESERTLFRRQNIGFIFQFFNLIPTLSVWENITLPLELNGKMDPAGIQRAQSLLESVELADRKATFPDRLSGGEQQRIAIARALVHDPLLVLADEPTGNLDEDTGRHVLDLLDRLTRQSGKNLVMVTHNQEAASQVDRIVWLSEGKLVEHHGPEN
jgi:putative ABC transport system ATP-binding protein